MGGRSYAGIFFSGSWIWCTLSLRLIQQVPQQCLQVSQKPN